MTFYKELYLLSPNCALFTALQTGQDLSATSSTLTTASSEQQIFSQIREAIVESLEKDDPAAINNLSEALRDDNERLQLYGEVLLAWSAATEAGNDKYRKVLRSAVSPLLNLRPTQPLYARALREWLSLLLDRLSSGTGQRPTSFTPEQWLDIHYLRASHTNQCRPGLVGESFYMVGLAADEAGDPAKWKQCLECVVKDVGRNLDREDLPQNLRFEAGGMWYWYQKAYNKLMKIVSEPSARQEIQSMKERIQRLYEDVHFEPVEPAMIGPLAQTYLTRSEYLKRVLREIRVARREGADLAPVCYKYDYCHDIDTFLFALERHEAVLPILGSLVQVNYEPAVQEALDALKQLDEE